MGFIVVTIFGYLVFNVAVWLSIGTGGIIAMALANFLGAVLTAVYFRKEITVGSKAKKGIAVMGSVGILLIVLGL